MSTASVGGSAKDCSEVTPTIQRAGSVTTIDCRGLHYHDVNEASRAAVAGGSNTLRLLNVNGQRYIGTGLKGDGLRIEVRGTPGQDAGMFMDGPSIEIYGNAQDGVGNTMNAGEVIVHGSTGDVLGYGMRRGRIFVRGDVGYRAGIHMKAHDGARPVIVCGGKAGDFFGEYMAGGLLVLLGMDSQLEGPIVGTYVGAGMHGGEIWVRGEIDPWRCGAEVRAFTATDADKSTLAATLTDYCRVFRLNLREVLASTFTRIVPTGYRPYAGLYTYL
jgi:glutamate synthase domain-containing protein 3